MFDHTCKVKKYPHSLDASIQAALHSLKMFDINQYKSKRKSQPNSILTSFIAKLLNMSLFQLLESPCAPRVAAKVTDLIKIGRDGEKCNADTMRRPPEAQSIIFTVQGI